tara:strand:- start:286 stop:477 length:192 start_codon:yes stop_codon:yes gene_type:complete
MNINTTPPTSPRPTSPPNIRKSYQDYKAKNMSQRNFTINISDNDRAELRLLKQHFLSYENTKK